MPAGDKNNRILVAWAEFSTKIKIFRGKGPEVNKWLIEQKKKGANKVGYS